MWLLGSSRLRTIGHTGRCRADFTKPIAPKFSAPYCQLLPLKHFRHCLQQKMATIPSALRSGTDIATDVWGAGARLRISGYAGTRAEESPSAAAQTGLPVSLHGARTAKADCRSNRDGCRIDRYCFRAYEGRWNNWTVLQNTGCSCWFLS